MVLGLAAITACGGFIIGYIWGAASRPKAELMKLQAENAALQTTVRRFELAIEAMEAQKHDRS